MKQIRRHITYANVMSSIAVFMILGGATAVAATKIGANELKANSIKTGKIVKEAVTAGKIKSGAVTESRLADAAVTTNKLADNAVTTPKIANKSITGAKLDLGALGTVPQANTANVANSVANEFFAVVAADGTLVRGTSGVTTAAEGVGTARVIIGTPTANCFTVATPGGNNPGGNNLGQISVNPSSTNPNSFWIVTANTAGTLTDVPFTLYARC